MKSAILLSGGIDSSALAFLTKPDYAFVVDYGQVCAEAELRSAKKIAHDLGIPITAINVNCKHLGSGELAGKGNIDVSPSPEWWPFRNQLLITLVGHIAVQMHIDSLLFGTVVSDCFHADGTKEFFLAIDELMSLQEGTIKVSAPAIDMSSADLIRISHVSPEIIGWTHSCHTHNYSCGRCRGCQKHIQVLKEVGFL